MISRLKLEKLYNSGLSMMDISMQTGFSHSKISYWMDKYNISRRTRSDATYIKRNPEGDPFKIKKNLNSQERELRGLGLGLYWGEGTKRNKYSVRLGNTDPDLINKFIEFLIKICNIKISKLRFGLQIFSDINPKEALKFWQKSLGLDSSQFQKVIVTPSRGLGSYKRKSKYGVLTIYYSNKKLRDIINEMLTIYKPT